MDGWSKVFLLDRLREVKEMSVCRLSTASVLLSGFSSTSPSKPLKLPVVAHSRRQTDQKTAAERLSTKGNGITMATMASTGSNVKAAVILTKSLSELSWLEGLWYLLIDYLSACLASLLLFLPFNCAALFNATSHPALFFHLSLCHLFPLHISKP